MLTNKEKKQPVIWVLIDKRVGNDNQVIALAEELGVEYVTQLIEYNNFARLPNYILSFWPIHVKKSILIKLKSEQFPDFIISCGRRTAAVALHLKKLSNDKTKIIQIMRPNIDPKEFELIILPQHDYFNGTLPNIIRIIGALNNIQKKIPSATEALKANYPELGDFIAVIIGGSNKNYSFTQNNAKILSRILRKITDNHSLPLFFTFSRRTPNEVKAVIRKNFSFPNIIYDPLDNTPNPYPGIIGVAEYIISTADSISMCSEAAATGKPIYVFCPEDFNLKKHKFFIQQLVDLEMVKKLEVNTDFLEKYEYEPLSEITKIANIIKSNSL